MLRFLADENFDGYIVRGLRKHDPAIELVRAQDSPIASADDRELLAWAAENDRIILTHDRKTMPTFAYDRIAAGQKMPGVFVFGSRLPTGRAIEEIILLNECSEQREWTGRVVYLPL